MTPPNPRLPATAGLLHEVAGLVALVLGVAGAITFLFFASPLLGGAAVSALVGYGGYLLSTSEG